MRSVGLWECDEDGEPTQEIIGWHSLQWRNEAGAAIGGGSFAMNLTELGASADAVKSKARLVITVDYDDDGNPAWQTNSHIVLQSSGRPILSEDGSGFEQTWVFQDLNAILAALTLRPDGDTSESRWISGTPGQILAVWWAEGVARGVLDGMEKDWTGSLDSRNAAWDSAKTFTIECHPGMTMLDAMVWLAGKQAIEWKWRQHRLRVFNYDTSADAFDGTDEDLPYICIESGRDLQDGDRTSDASELVNAVLVLGESDRYATAEDAGSIAEFGRWEGTITASGVDDQDQLQEIADAAAASLSEPVTWRSFTIPVYDEVAQSRQPYTKDSWTIGDRVAVSDGVSSPEQASAKVQSIVLRTDQHGAISLTVALDYRYAQKRSRFEDFLSSLSRGVPGTEVPKGDRIAPSPPSGWSYSTGTEEPGTGPQTAYIQGAWTNPTTDSDGQPLRDLDTIWLGYRRTTGSPRWRWVDCDLATSGRITGLPLGTEFDIAVRAEDKHRNFSTLLEATATTAVGTGEMRSTQTDGTPSFEVVGDGWTAKKRAVSVLDALEQGVELDADSGVRLFDSAGSAAIWLDTSGDASFTQNLYVGGDTLIDGSTEIGGTLDVTGIATFSDELHVGGETHLGGALFLEADLDAQGFTIEGARLTTGTGNVVIDDDTISWGSNVITFSGSAIQVSDDLTIGGSLQVTSTFTATGTATHNSTTVLNGALDHNGSTYGFCGATVGGRPTITGTPGSGQTGDTLRLLVAGLASRGLVIDSLT